MEIIMAFAVYTSENFVSLYTKDPDWRSQGTEERVADWDMTSCSMVDAETAQSM
jgi:hypothetical protein